MKTFLDLALQCWSNVHKMMLNFAKKRYRVRDFPGCFEKTLKTKCLLGVKDRNRGLLSSMISFSGNMGPVFYCIFGNLNRSGLKAGPFSYDVNGR